MGVWLFNAASANFVSIRTLVFTLIETFILYRSVLFSDGETMVTAEIQLLSLDTILQSVSQRGKRNSIIDAELRN